MKSTKEEIAELLEECQSIVDVVERERRPISRAEKARAEFVLEKMRNLRDTEQLRKAIEDMNGLLTKPPAALARTTHRAVALASGSTETTSRTSRQQHSEAALLT